MFQRKRKEVKMESLWAQLDFLDALLSRHHIGANDARNPEIAQLHFEIIDLIVKIR